MEILDAGGVIKKLREKRKWSQLELAKKMGYNNRTTIAKIEAGDNKLNQEKMERMARIFDVSLVYLCNSMERDLYVLDFVVEDTGDKVILSNPFAYGATRKCIFSKDDWEEFKMAGKIKPVVDIFESGVIEYKKAPDTLIDIERLSEDRRYLVEKIITLPDDRVHILRSIIEQIFTLTDS